MAFDLTLKQANNNDSLVRERERILLSTGESAGLISSEEPTIDDVFMQDGASSQRLKIMARHEPSRLDKLLLKIHYLRRRKLSIQEEAQLQNFLASSYLLSKDVRFFNEFLFCSQERQQVVHDLCVNEFLNLLDDDGCHHVPKASRQEARAYVERVSRTPARSMGLVEEPLRIALLGLPGMFTPSTFMA